MSSSSKKAWYKELHWKIIIGLIAGLVWGLIAINSGLSGFTSDFIKPVGTIFIRLLELVAVPLVVASLVLGVAGLSDIRKLSRMGGRTIGIFMLTTVFAITIGVLLVSLIRPGDKIPDETREQLTQSYQYNVEERSQSAEVVLNQGPLQPLVDMVPRNFFAAASNNANMLQVVFVAVLIGIGLIQISSEKAKPLLSFMESLNETVLRIIEMIMELAPYGVFGLISALIVDLAGDDPARVFGLLSALGWYMMVVLLGLILHALLVYRSLLKFFTKIKFRDFIEAVRPALLVGFSTSSSNATLPVSMECVHKKVGVHEEVASFVLPVGATINMDGTSLYQAVAAIFIAQTLGMDLSFSQQLTIIFTATLASIGTAGVPGAGIIMLVIVLKSVDIPIEGIALILGVDRLLDMCRTVMNITGDMVVSTVIAAQEGMIDTSGEIHS